MIYTTKKLTMLLAIITIFKIIPEPQRRQLVQFQVVGVIVQHIKELLNKAGENWTLL